MSKKRRLAQAAITKAVTLDIAIANSTERLRSSITRAAVDSPTVTATTYNSEDEIIQGSGNILDAARNQPHAPN